MNSFTLQKSITLYEEISNTTINFPKILRHTLGQKIETTILNAIENIICAEYDYPVRKDAGLLSALIKTETLKILIRTATNKQIIKETMYFKWTAQLIEIQKMINGWRKSLIK